MGFSEVFDINVKSAKRNKRGNKKLYATKVGINIKPPSLYYSFEKENGYVISSEKLNNNNWKRVKNNSLIEVVNKNLKIQSLL